MIHTFRKEHGFLSNMADAEIDYEGVRFPSTENAYMWEKCRDCKVTQEIIHGEQGFIVEIPWLEYCQTYPPNEVKKKSREVTLREDWNDVKLKIMYNILVLKFTQEPFKTKLLATGTENIVEGNYWQDTFWGVDLKETPNVGENWLGRLIMDIRTKLKNGKL